LPHFATDGLSAKLINAVYRIVLPIYLCIGLAQADDSLEYKIKAAYLYNFTKFISWPSIDPDTFNICIVGVDPFQHYLDSVESKTALGKPIRVLHFEDGSQARNCQIIYFDDAQAANILSPAAHTLLVGSLRNGLTVSSQPFFAESGGMIGFVLEEGKVKLHINLKAVKDGGLNISAKLIEVSSLVGENSRD